MFTGSAQEFNPNPPGFIETTPQTSGWNKLHPVGKNHSLVISRVFAQAAKAANQKKSSYHLDLTNYYDYCKITDINILGHTLDCVGHDHICRINFYFASIEDKAHFVLKFE